MQLTRIWCLATLQSLHIPGFFRYARTLRLSAGSYTSTVITTMPTTRFKAPLSTIGSWTVLRLPKSASARLPSRGMTVVEGTINGSHFHDVLEPDGRGGHWLLVTPSLQEAAQADPGDTVMLTLEPTKEWPEPEVPADVKKALASVPQAQKLWNDITPAARWDWIRWIRSTREPETRRRRIEVACSKLTSGARRPCCFNRNVCTEPAVSKNGMLLEAEQEEN